MGWFTLSVAAAATPVGGNGARGAAEAGHRNAEAVEVQRAAVGGQAAGAEGRGVAEL